MKLKFHFAAINFASPETARISYDSECKVESKIAIRTNNAHSAISESLNLHLSPMIFLLFSYHMHENVTKDVNTTGKYVKSQK